MTKNKESRRRGRRVEDQQRGLFVGFGDKISCRRVLNIMVFLGFMVNYMLRVNLTFAIVYMVLNINETMEITKEIEIMEPLHRDTRSIKIEHRFLHLESVSHPLQEHHITYQSHNQSFKPLEYLSIPHHNHSFKLPLISGGSYNHSYYSGSSDGGKDFNQSQIDPDSSQFSDRILFLNDTTKLTEIKIVENLNGAENSSSVVSSNPNITNVETGDEEEVIAVGGQATGFIKTSTESAQKVTEEHKITKPKESVDMPTTSDYQKRYNKFSWTEKKQGLLLGSFFWGYICTELPGGRLAELIGARAVFGYATLGASVLTLLTPLSAKINFLAVMILRIILGVLLGPTWPSVLPLAGKWIPLHERGKFMSNMMASSLGAAFTLPICSFIIESSSWEYVFYATGLIGFVYGVLWFLLIYDSPAEHPRITTEEKRYIESLLIIKSNALQIKTRSDTSAYISDQENGLGVPEIVIASADSNVETSDDEAKLSEVQRKQKTELAGEANLSSTDDDGCKSSSELNPTEQNGQVNSPTKSAASVTSSKTNGSLSPEKHSSTTYFRRKSDTVALQQQDDAPSHSHGSAPWLQIITSIPVWAFVITHTASVFGYNTITVQLPTYMKHILDYDIKSNGILSSLPYLGKYLMAIGGGSIADHVIRSKVLSKTATKKLFTGIGVLIPGLLMLLQMYVGQDRVISIIIFTATLTANGFVTGGYLSNSLDLAPNYSGTIFGLANMFSSSGGAVSALIVGYLTNNNQVFGQWQKVFFIVSCLYILGALTFLIFGTTNVQPWNNEKTRKKSIKTNSDPVREAEPLKEIKSL